MKVFTISNFNELSSILDRFKKSNIWIFRGQSNHNWELLPKAFRNEYKSYNDEQILKSWKNRAGEYLTKEPINDWEWLSIAQHHGVPTRLLDWTINPLVACFFSVNENFESDGVIYAIYNNVSVNSKTYKPYEIENLSIVRPKAVTPRITRQSGLFTIHPLEDLIIKDKSFDFFEKIVIPRECKKEILFKLNQFGVNYATIYPDLEGLAKHICWHIENKKYWDTIVFE